MFVSIYVTTGHNKRLTYAVCCQCCMLCAQDTMVLSGVQALMTIPQPSLHCCLQHVVCLPDISAGTDKLQL